MPMAGMKTKAASLHWEFMFARSMHQTPDMVEQHRLLSCVAELVDREAIRSTLTKTLTPINAANLREAHRMVESGGMIGKAVLEGWS